MAIDPRLIYAGVRLRDPDAEAELVAFLKHLVWQDYQRTLGPLAEDYLQVLSMRVVLAIRAGKMNNSEKLIPYCKEMAKNVRVDGLRVAVRAARKLVAIDEARFQRSGDNAEAELLLAEQFGIVLELMERLDPFAREIVRRHYFEHHSIADIAAELARPALQIQRVKDRAVEKLRRDHRARGWGLLGGKGKPAGTSLTLVAAA